VRRHSDGTLVCHPFPGLAFPALLVPRRGWVEEERGAGSVSSEFV